MRELLSRTQRSSIYTIYCERSELPQMMLAAAMIPVLALPALFALSAWQQSLLDDLDWFIYVCFAIDMAIKLYLAPSAVEHLRKNWLDVVILALPALRLFRLVRTLRLIRVLKAARLLTFAAKGLQALLAFIRKRHLDATLVVVIVLVAGSAGLVTVAERDGGGSIKGFGDALWWAIATVTTVGYGDATPVTVEGRVTAIFLMVTGIVFYGMLVASISAHFVESGQDDRTTALEEKLNEVTAELSEIKSLLNERPETPA